jgi:hypothetical protein
MEFKDIKEGTKLFSLVYWTNFMGDCKREMRGVRVKKNKGRFLKLTNGISWTISNKEFNHTWFLTKKEAYAKALQIHIKEK